MAAVIAAVRRNGMVQIRIRRNCTYELRGRTLAQTLLDLPGHVAAGVDQSKPSITRLSHSMASRRFKADRKPPVAHHFMTRATASMVLSLASSALAPLRLFAAATSDNDSISVTACRDKCVSSCQRPMSNAHCVIVLACLFLYWLHYVHRSAIESASLNIAMQLHLNFLVVPLQKWTC